MALDQIRAGLDDEVLGPILPGRLGELTRERLDGLVRRLEEVNLGSEVDFLLDPVGLHHREGRLRQARIVD